MKIAIPLAAGQLSPHFGHCEEFALAEVDNESGQLINTAKLAAPPHEPGVLPAWLREQGADAIIAGGMGQRAQGLFAMHGIRVIVGAPRQEPEKLVRDYLAGSLVTGENLCDH